MKSVAILTDDKYLYQKLRLELEDTGDFFVHQSPERCDVCFVDGDMPKSLDGGALVIRLVRDAKDDGAHLPLPIGEAARLAGGAGTGGELFIAPDVKCAVLHGKKIRLTEVEFSLFSALFSARGDFVSREELVRRVWNSERSAGVVNVYVHYLREKLEDGGEKIIISSRQAGYAIDKKYFGGALCLE